MSPDEDQWSSRIAELRWYHRMELPAARGAVVTDGVHDGQRTLPRLHLPDSLRGRSVLDIGAWDGFHSFEAARRGATRVLATDSYVWEGRTWGSKDGFLIARELLGLEGVVDDQTIDVMDIAPETVGGRFDVVLMLGILYHLRDPIGAIERAASVCSDLLVLETETSLNAVPFAAARVFPGRELNGDHTNWFAFNGRSLCGLLRSVGFADVRVVYRSPWLHRAIHVGRQVRRGDLRPFAARSQRIVVHARR